MILGCDGVWETKTNQEILKLINKYLKKDKDLKFIIETLLD